MLKTAADIHSVESPDQWRAQALKFGQRNFPTLTIRSNTVSALVNAGRWLIVCPWCNNAPAAHPEWQLAICYECGSEYVPEFPEQWALIDELLMLRPVTARNWTTGESLEDLAIDNELHLEASA